MSGCKPASIPIDPDQKLEDDKEGDLVDTSQYQRLVGRLIYLSHTQLDIALVMSIKTTQQNIKAYTNVDWASSITDRSTSGYCTYVWGNLVTQQKVLEELKMSVNMLMKLDCNNKNAISIAQNPMQHDRTKHVEIDRHFIKEKVNNGTICMPFVPTMQQIVDILT
ncbi:Copia protein [Vitis vinifera]|uniref:Copia protein n=1 Tax=Vitis vinifera TaxID=29760 RepID=A0A438KB63_VITVI|nr:Copia protein [Vitis vinifera]